mmetsp:Transcript_59990/g.121809  ORF Transcript_59990/g.121809 Transcript_59990/m.121809 type:complete len:360 (+) Transcript_59990:447-1526(+)
MGTSQGIQLQSSLLFHPNVGLPDVPLRKQAIRAKGLHPIGEALVQPKVIPPLHRHQVAKPLMRQFMRNDRTNPVLLCGRHGAFIAKERDLPIGHQAPVFHGASREIRDCNHVHLWQRIRNTKELVVELKRADAALQRKIASGAVAWTCKDASENTTLRLSTHEFEFAHAKGQQVGAHLGGDHKNLLLLAIRASFLAAGRHVGDSCEVAGINHRHYKGGFPGRFIPTREAFSRINGFELGGGHETLHAFGIGVLRTVKSRHLVVQGATEFDFQHTFAHRENFLEANDGRFGFGPQGDGIGLAHGALRWSKARRREHQLMRVHADTIRGHLHVTGNLHHPIKGKLLNVRLQSQIVVLWQHI